MRVIVCGGREYDDFDAVFRTLGKLSPPRGEDAPTIVHGGGTGADALSGAVAAHHGFYVEPHPADWGRYGRVAGPIRNQQMLDAGADLVIAFPGGRGTADMVERAKRAGVEVREVPA